MVDKANEDAEKNVIKTNQDFHNLMENRKKNAEERVKQLKNQALKDIKNTSVKIAIESVEKLLKNSLDKSKLDKIYTSSIEETKLALKKNLVRIGHKYQWQKNNCNRIRFWRFSCFPKIKSKRIQSYISRKTS